MGAEMIVDCDRCEVRGDACQDCVITVLLGAPPGGVELDGAEARALQNLAAAGMVPRLQLVDGEQRHGEQPHSGHEDLDHVEGAQVVKRSSICGERPVRRVG
ncbi:MAG: hypothetical protein GEV09_20195 [Pseudonocardiaceae bacterium]|nr:hypothetical protein [Pseudonocardiaceae bacterium]